MYALILEKIWTNKNFFVSFSCLATVFAYVGQNSEVGLHTNCFICDRKGLQVAKEIALILLLEILVAM